MSASRVSVLWRRLGQRGYVYIRNPYTPGPGSTKARFVQCGLLVHVYAAHMQPEHVQHVHVRLLHLQFVCLKFGHVPNFRGSPLYELFNGVQICSGRRE